VSSEFATTEEALPQGQARAHVLQWRTSESRVRENRMHGWMREDWQNNHGIAI